MIQIASLTTREDAELIALEMQSRGFATSVNATNVFINEPTVVPIEEHQLSELRALGGLLYESKEVTADNRQFSMCWSLDRRPDGQLVLVEQETLTQSDPYNDLVKQAYINKQAIKIGGTDCAIFAQSCKKYGLQVYAKQSNYYLRPPVDLAQLNAQIMVEGLDVSLTREWSNL